MDIPTAKKGSRFFILLTVLLLASALAINFYLYYRALNFDIAVELSCDPAQEVCTTDEEYYYAKAMVGARALSHACANAEDSDACMHALVEEGVATALACEEYAEEWESCTTPEDYAAEEEESIEMNESENEEEYGE
ncbi:MAG TPA: hypothetical protein VGE18_01625 [Candidatus Paceibacterota bacterium]